MQQLRLGADDAFLILTPRWAELDPALQAVCLALLALVPLGLVLWLSRYERKLIPRGHAAGLLALRLAVIAILWLLVGLQPRLVSVQSEETPGRVRIAVDLSTSMDVQDAQSPHSRKEIVRRLLASEGRNLLGRLAERHQVEIVGFHQQAFELPASQLFDLLSERSGESMATDLNAPLANVGTAKEQPLLGIVLFSDGQHNVGAAPIARAGELGKLRVPIYPVVIGTRAPPSDLAIVDVQAPSKVFKDAEATIEVRGKATGLPAQELTIEMQRDGKPVLPEHRQIITHRGPDQAFTVRFQAKMDAVGVHAVTIKAISKEGKEITLANNTATRIIRVSEDKAKVLLIDGAARWEYHYLANALMRDPTIALDRVVFTQPRIGALKADQFESAGLPRGKLPEVKADAKEPDPLLDYDCILLGDVAPEQLPLADRKRLEKYVAERGGTLILIAGKRHLPMEYVKGAAAGNDPLVKMLPIAAPRVLMKDAGFTLQVTAQGRTQPFLHLDPEQSAGAWPELPKHYWSIVGKAKPAASALLTAANSEKDANVLVQQNYGFGRVVFSGLDSTWRWRFRVGDVYHHRFWGQLVRWAAADRLLPAGNRLVRYGPREPFYAEGQAVELAVRASDAVPPLKNAAEARAKIYRKSDKAAEELVAVVSLSANARQPGLLEASVPDLPAGSYRMEPDIAEYRVALADAKSPPALFRVLPRDNRELADLSANWPLLQTLADRSDGKLYTPDTVDELVDRLSRRIERIEHREESRPWQDEPLIWWTLSILLGLLTLEWSWRKWLDLA